MAKLLVLAASAFAVSAFDSRKDLWNEDGRAPALDVIQFHIAMPMSNFPAIDARLAQISNPLHADYGKWMTKEAVDALATTPKAIVSEVMQWATSTGAKCTQMVSVLRCQATISAVESLVSTRLSVYSHKENSSRKIVRMATGAPAAIPAHLEGKVVMLTGLTQFPVPPLGRITAPNADNYIVPSTILKMYNVALDGNAQTTQAAVEFQNYPAPLATDLALFIKDTATPPYAIGANVTIGPYAPQAGADESTLDVMYLGAVGQNNINFYWTVADWQFEFATDASNMPDAKIPKVLSVSYAWYELQQCEISPSVAPCAGGNVTKGSITFVNAVNALYATIVARGVTILSASGDSGAHGRSDSSCSSSVVRPDYPAASPYITAVGGTRLLPATETAGGTEPICSTIGCASGGTEVLSQSGGTDSLGWGSGGGFSTVAARPTWQDAAVTTFLKNTTANPGVGNFNAAGRGFPDVSAHSHKFYIIMSGQNQGVDGTSAATPTFAGIVSNLNAWRTANGKPLLGFVNPLLYQIYATNPMAFNDVTFGNNACSEYCCPKDLTDGYFCTTGWDAASGLGTPNYAAIKAAITSMGI